MSVSAGLVKELLFGKNIAVLSPATFLTLCESVKRKIKPEDFRPFIPIVGGMSIWSGAAIDAMVFGGDWIRLCREAGSDVKNAVICLAANYDDHRAMVAFALELGMMANKPSKEGGSLLSREEFSEVLIEVFAKNYAGIQELSGTWGVSVKPNVLKLDAPEARSFWREKLGHDVLIHPKTLRPCCDEQGEFLAYHGLCVDESTGDKRDAFKFARRNGEELVTPKFPSEP